MTRIRGRKLVRYIWIPIVLSMVAVLSMTAFMIGSPPDYKATATMVAKNPSNGLEKTLNFADIVVSNSVALRVKKQLNLDDSVDQLLTRIQVASGRSNLYTITVEDSDPQRAAGIANAVAREAAALYVELGSGSRSPMLTELDKYRDGYQQRHVDAARALTAFDNAHPGLIKAIDAGTADPDLAAQRSQLVLNEKAVADSYLKFEDRASQTRVGALSSQRDFEAFMVDEAVAKPDRSRSMLRIAYAGGLALVFGYGIVLLRQYRDRSVRAPAEVERMLGSPVIATIPRATGKTLRVSRAT
jgi:capsular polysaccharide biosynthesis protein